MRKRSTMTEVVVRDYSTIKANHGPQYPRHRSLQSIDVFNTGSNNDGVCKLDETGSYGVFPVPGGEDEALEQSDELSGSTTQNVSFVYQVETNGQLRNTAINALELFMTEQMLGYMFDECNVSSSAQDGLRRLRDRKHRAVSERRIHEASTEFAWRRRRAQESLQNVVLGLSSSPADELILETEIACTEKIATGNESKCVVVEGNVLIATNTSAGTTTEIEDFYYGAIESTLEDQTINWTEADPTILHVTYRGRSREAVASEGGPSKLEKMWIPMLCVVSFFVVLLIVFLIHDRRSTHRRRYEDSRRGVKVDDVRLGLSARIDEDPNEDEDSSGGEGENGEMGGRASAQRGVSRRRTSTIQQEVIMEEDGSDGSIDIVEETKSEVFVVSSSTTSALQPSGDGGDSSSYVDALDTRFQQEASLTTEIDSSDARIEGILREGRRGDLEEDCNEYVTHLKMPLPPVSVHPPMLPKVADSSMKLASSSSEEKSEVLNDVSTDSSDVEWRC